MALDNYSNLRAAVRSWSNDDSITEDQFNEIISIVESDMYATGPNPLRIKEMEFRAREATPTADRFLALPADFLEMRRLSIVLDERLVDLTTRSPQSLVAVTSTGRPTDFSVTSQISFNRPADEAYILEMVYYKRLTSLSSANPTNDILTIYPNIYFFGCIAAAYLLGGEEDKADLFNKKFMSTLIEANSASDMGQFGPSQTRYNACAVP